jgi:hypothetical protein
MSTISRLFRRLVDWLTAVDCFADPWLSLRDWADRPPHHPECPTCQ